MNLMPAVDMWFARYAIIVRLYLHKLWLSHGTDSLTTEQARSSVLKWVGRNKAGENSKDGKENKSNE